MPAGAPIVDGHNDLPWEMRVLHGGDLKRRDLAREGLDLHTDIPRLRRGGVGAQFWSVYVPAGWAGDEALRGVLEQIAFVHRMVAAYPGGWPWQHPPPRWSESPPVDASPASWVPRADTPSPDRWERSGRCTGSGYMSSSRRG